MIERRFGHPNSAQTSGLESRFYIDIVFWYQRRLAQTVEDNSNSNINNDHNSSSVGNNNDDDTKPQLMIQTFQ